jgi:hypothetical protein
MSGRGGAGRGQGRKPALDPVEAFEVGERCEYLWHKAAENDALAEHNKLPISRMVQDEQARAALIPMPARGRRRMNPEITEAIDEITEGARRVTLALRRPHGEKAKVLADAVAWCEEQFGQIISANKADECWKAFRRFRKRAAKQGDL